MKESITLLSRKKLLATCQRKRPFAGYLVSHLLAGLAEEKNKKAYLVYESFLKTLYIELFRSDSHM